MSEGVECERLLAEVDAILAGALHAELSELDSQLAETLVTLGALISHAQTEPLTAQDRQVLAWITDDLTQLAEVLAR